jgi:uncharacterized protein YjbJ (UPF0337 family)
MNKDQVNGTVDELVGSAKHKAGDLTGDVHLQVEGMAQQVKGKVENAWGRRRMRSITPTGKPTGKPTCNTTPMFSWWGTLRRTSGTLKRVACTSPQRSVIWYELQGKRPDLPS